jgi:hypothetical protein
VVVEGVGAVVEKYYGPAFVTLKAKLAGRRDIHVTFVDQSAFWSGVPLLAAKMRSIIASIGGWGAGYLDKSDPADLSKYKALNPDVVIIATPDASHVAVAERWLNHNPRPEQIFIEKPLANSVDAARRLLGIVAPYDDGALAYDHYRARLLPVRFEMDLFLGFLEKKLRRFTFYFLEDHSGGDPGPEYHSVGRDGAIENEQREKTLNQGLILDVMPHIIAILAHFCRVETMRVTRVKAGQYVGVDGDPNKRTQIDRETFAEARFVCDDYIGNQLDGVAYIGKGVRGVRALGAEYDHNVKLLDIEGHNGEKIRFDLRSSGNGASQAHLIGTKITVGLNPRPYETFLEKVADGTYLEDRLGLNVGGGKRILEVLEDMRYAIPEKDLIPTYPSGMTGVRQSLYLEEVLDRLPILFGR